MANSVAVDSREKIPTSLAELIGINLGSICVELTMCGHATNGRFD